MKLIFLLLILSSCVNKDINYPKIFRENNSYFEKNRTSLIKSKNEVLEKIQTSKKTNFDINELSKKTENKLREIGIHGITIYELKGDSTTYEIMFNVAKNWNIEKLKVVRIRFSSNEKQTKKGYHFYDNYHIDIWGQGDGFYIISDTDLI